MEININSMTFNHPKPMLVINTKRIERRGEDRGSPKTSKVNPNKVKTLSKKVGGSPMTSHVDQLHKKRKHEAKKYA